MTLKSISVILWIYLEEEVAIQSSILALKVPWTAELDRLQSMGIAKGWARLTEWLNNNMDLLFALTIIYVLRTKNILKGDYDSHYLSNTIFYQCVLQWQMIFIILAIMVYLKLITTWYINELDLLYFLKKLHWFEKDFQEI